MTHNAAKQLVRTELERRQLPYIHLSAHTINFSGLARDESISVTVHGWRGDPAWSEIRQAAREAGVMLEARRH